MLQIVSKPDLALYGNNIDKGVGGRSETCLENNAIMRTITKSLTTHIIKAIKSCRMRWPGPVAGLEKIMAQNNLVVKIDRTIQHRRKLILGDIVSA
jgi:hypothetical protein